MTPSTVPEPLILNPIGVIRTSMRLKFEAPHQPEASPEDENVIELFPHRRFEHALGDLEGFDRVWLIWWFHRNKSWRPLVLPPRGEMKRRGVFATRSPHRPNPIGLTATRLLKVSRLRLTVGSVDLLDGTPILDIKPYVSAIDAFPESANGWLKEVEQELSAPAAFKVTLLPGAAAQLDWLRDGWNIDFLDRARAILERNPHPHRTRRISRYGDSAYRMGCGAWKIVFAISRSEVQIQRIIPGYPNRLLNNAGYSEVPDREAQVAFRAQWGDDEILSTP